MTWSPVLALTLNDDITPSLGGEFLKPAKFPHIGIAQNHSLPVNQEPKTTPTDHREQCTESVVHRTLFRSQGSARGGAPPLGSRNAWIAPLTLALRQPLCVAVRNAFGYADPAVSGARASAIRFRSCNIRAVSLCINRFANAASSNL